MGKRIKAGFFDKFSTRITTWAGSSYAFTIAMMIVVIWAACGPLFDYSETWQLVINTGTTIITFLMVFLIQKSQNKDGKAIQLKLNELIAADERASNRMVDLEDLTEEELDKLHKFYAKLADLAEKEDNIHTSHSIDAAVKVSRIKKTQHGLPVKNSDLTDSSLNANEASKTKKKRKGTASNGK